MTRTRSQVGRGSKTKGQAYERHLCRKLNQWAGLDIEAAIAAQEGRDLPELFRRTPLSGGFDRSRFPGDLIAPRWFRPVVEAKNRKAWTWATTIRGDGPVWQWWEQAQEQAAGRPPWLIFTNLREPDYMAMSKAEAGDLIEVHGGIKPLVVVRDRPPIFLLDEVLRVVDAEWFGKPVMP